jgi:hypothetical protein
LAALRACCQIRRRFSPSTTRGQIQRDWLAAFAKDFAGGHIDSPVGFMWHVFSFGQCEALPENSMADAERWAASMPVTSCAIDDETAIKVIDGAVEVVSEGHWQRFVHPDGG